MMRKKTKVFCIGFHKTGTTSIGTALAILGYRVAAQFGTKNPDIADNALPKALEIAQRFDAFEDNPWPILYKEMDQQFPGSKFILTIREPKDWYKSAVNHFGEKTTPMREWIYGSGKGSPKGNAKLYINRYRAHNAEVTKYFRKRKEDLLVMRLDRGMNWEKICGFLGEPIPVEPFPYENKRRHSDKDSNKTMLVNSNDK